MLGLRRIQHLFVVCIAASLLAACGGTTVAEQPTAVPVPTAKPTSTPRPRPTAKPRPTAAPTEEPTAEPTVEPTAKPSSDTKLLAVEVGDLKTYTSDNQLFSVDAPEAWTLKDNSKPTEAIVTWIDPNENAFMLVDIFEQETKQTPEELSDFLKKYLDNTFGSQTDFAQEAPVDSGPSKLIVWSYTAEATGGVKAPLLANSFIKQIDNKVSLFTFVLPEAQFDTLQPDLDKILGSYNIDSSVSLSGEPTAVPAADDPIQIGELETYNYETGLFSIDVPKTWKLQDNSKPGEAIILWNEPNGRALLAVDLFKQAKQQSSDELTTFLKDFLTKTFGKEQDFVLDEPKEQSDGSILLVWSYTDKSLNDLKVIGNSFIEQRDDKVSILSTVVPDAQFDALLPETNKIIGSYKIDPSAELP